MPELSSVVCFDFAKLNEAAQAPTRLGPSFECKYSYYSLKPGTYDADDRSLSFLSLELGRGGFIP